MKRAPQTCGRTPRRVRAFQRTLAHALVRIDGETVRVFEPLEGFFTSRHTLSDRDLASVRRWAAQGKLEHHPAHDKPPNECPSCTQAPEEPAGICPLKHDLNNDQTSCRCCAKCRDNCAREL